MSDTSAFIAGCATTGAAALMLLLARISVGESSVQVDNLESTATQESIMPVPAPPPPTVDGANPLAEDKLLADLQTQQELTDRLESQLAQQDLLLRDLESQLEQQRQETQALIARLNTYEASVSMLTTQQQQFARVQGETDKAQSSLVWVGAGLVMVVLVGGALVLVILVIMVAFQSRTRSPQAPGPIIYSEVPVPPNPYYQNYPTEFLPPPRRTRRVYPQDIYDRD